MEQLRKVYGTSGRVKVAVKGISLGIPRGECFGYLGINGAGKTSTLAMLTGDVLPTRSAGFASESGTREIYVCFSIALLNRARGVSGG